MRILLLRTWLTNVWNGFIDKGAKSLIKQAAPRAEIVEVSGYPNYIADIISLDNVSSIVSRKLGAGNKDIVASQGQKKNIVNIAELLAE